MGVEVRVGGGGETFEVSLKSLVRFVRSDKFVGFTIKR